MGGVAHTRTAGRSSRLPVRARGAAKAEERRHVSFAELVKVHHLRETALERGEIYSGEAEERYREFEEAFRKQHGRIVSAYWCTSVPSAVALAEKPGRNRRNRSRLSFHRVSDWATKEEPEIAAALHECDELAVKATEVLRGKTLRICMELVMASAAHLLSLVDAPSEHGAKGKQDRALRLERHALDRVRAYYHNAANGQAQLYYFLGLMLGVVIVGLAALLLGTSADLPWLNNLEFFGSLTAGALGAVVSVMSRIGSGRFRLEYEVGRKYPIFLGCLRPAVGGLFGIALYFAVKSGLLDLFKLPADPKDRLYFLLVIAFVAGFSERWARDALLVVGGRGDARAREPAPAPSTAADTQK
jgi:hypothetical protein